MATAVADIADGETFTMEEKSYLEQEQATAVEQTQAEEAKPETVSTEQANKLLGKITLYDECVARILYVQQDLDSEEEEISELKTQIKDLRESQKANYAKLKALNSDLRDIKNGQYQRKLFAGVEQTAEKPKPVDPATVTGIENLGMTEKENELLAAAEIKTVADLEKRMREDMLWHRKIKGFGQAKVDKLSDQLLAWRMQNPVPSDEDEDDEDDVIATDSDKSDVVADADDDLDDEEGMDAFDLDGEESQGDE